MSADNRRAILVYADWPELGDPTLMGTLFAAQTRGTETFSFEYDRDWLESPNKLELDPHLALFDGPQYTKDEHPNFGTFLDSCPDRWGRVLMERREAREARREERPVQRLMESDFLLGVHDEHRPGALRFKLDPDGPFLDDRTDLASPPMTSLRKLEHAAINIECDGAEEENDYEKWLRMLIAPGGSLGGARPKASVRDEHNGLWIAKFPSHRDREDKGAWEMVAHELAKTAEIEVAESRVERFNSPHHTFITRRFDRPSSETRLHFASAMTLLGYTDGSDASTGASYLDIAGILIGHGANPNKDLEQLWRRIVFNVCISNTDDHLRNHGFLLQPGKGWRLAPAYDINPEPHSHGLTLNINESDNSLDLDLVRSIAPVFRVKDERCESIIKHVTSAVSQWHDVAGRLERKKDERERMRSAFEK